MLTFLLFITLPNFTRIGDKKVLPALVGTERRTTNGTKKGMKLENQKGMMRGTED